MDPVSHLIFGRALAALAPRPRATSGARGVTMAIVVGSVAPDVDALLMPTGWDRYLVWHERGTHALLGTALDAAALAGLLWLALRAIERRRTRARDGGGAEPPTPTPTHDSPVTPPRRNQSTGGPAAEDASGTSTAKAGASHRGNRVSVRHAAPMPRFLHLWLAAWLGCVGHITLDLVSGGTIRLFAPLSAQPFGLPLTAMADPLIALPLIAFLLATLVWKPRVRALAVAVLCVLAGVLAVKAVSERMARAVYRDRVEASASGAAADGSRASLRAVEARWGTFTSWMFYDRTRDHLRAWVVDARTGAARLVVQRPLTPPPSPGDAGKAEALIASSRELETVQHLFGLYELTFVETQTRGEEVDVQWTDIRFCGPASCALWFGGTFESSGRAREQFVLIGGIRQARPVGRRAGG